MELTTFNSFISDFASLPTVLKERLLSVAAKLTPETRAKIKDELETMQKKETEILLTGTAKMAGAVRSAKKQSVAAKESDEHTQEINSLPSFNS